MIDTLDDLRTSEMRNEPLLKAIALGDPTSTHAPAPAAGTTVTNAAFTDKKVENTTDFAEEAHYQTQVVSARVDITRATIDEIKSAIDRVRNTVTGALTQTRTIPDAIREIVDLLKTIEEKTVKQHTLTWDFDFEAASPTAVGIEHSHDYTWEANKTSALTGEVEVRLRTDVNVAGSPKPNLQLLAIHTSHRSQAQWPESKLDFDFIGRGKKSVRFTSLLQITLPPIADEIRDMVAGLGEVLSALGEGLVKGYEKLKELFDESNPGNQEQEPQDEQQGKNLLQRIIDGFLAALKTALGIYDGTIVLVQSNLRIKAVANAFYDSWIDERRHDGEKGAHGPEDKDAKEEPSGGTKQEGAKPAKQVSQVHLDSLNGMIAYGDAGGLVEPPKLVAKHVAMTYRPLRPGKSLVTMPLHHYASLVGWPIKDSNREA